MSQRFLNLIRNGETAKVATAAEEDPAVITSRDAQGVSAFLWSIYSRQPLIRDFLLAHLPALDIFEASALGDCNRIELLLEQDAMLVHENSADGWAPLHLAAAFGGPQATALLLAHGAHVHRFSRNPMHNQPLHACIALGQDCETARLLIAQGADVNMEQAGGFTPLHQAAAAGNTGTRGDTPRGWSEPGLRLPSREETGRLRSRTTARCCGAATFRFPGLARCV